MTTLTDRIHNKSPRTAASDTADNVVPLVEIRGVTPARLLALCEGHNQYGSIKSTMVRRLLTDAISSGRLKSGDAVIEASSGNTGLALAGVGRELGLKVHIVLLDGTDDEITHRLRNLGANVHFCDRAGGMRGMLAFIKESFPGTYTLDQFRNKTIVTAYIDAHRKQLLDQLAGADCIPSHFFSCVGTGGTLQGLGAILRESWPGIKVIAIEKDADAAPIDGIRNTDIAYFGETDIYDRDFPDKTVYINSTPPLPDGLIASPSAGAILEAIHRYPLSRDDCAITVFCDGLFDHPSDDVVLA